MRVLELFSGYGTASFALKRIFKEVEIVGFSDIDKYANQVFRQNHAPAQEYPDAMGNWEENKELGDVKNINPYHLPDFDLLTGGFPCQAFSVAGKQLGELDPRGTLFYEIIRIAEVKKPRYMLLENVKGLTSKKHKPTFDKILSELERIGYHVHWKVLNTKDYGIPQNRERVWFVCFRDKSEYDSFTWPEKEELRIFIKDILEQEPVDKKFYLKENQVNKLLEALAKKNNNFQSRRFQKNIASTLAARDYKDPKIVDIQSVQWDSTGKGHHSQPDGTYSIEGVAPCLQAQGTSEKAKIFALRTFPRTGKDDKDRFQNPKFREDGCSNTLTAVEKDNLIVIDRYNNSIPNNQDVSTTLRTNLSNGNCQVINQGIFRRLTPKECFRLQGFLNDEINLDGLSDTQKYKLAGNGQSVNVVEKIMRAMFNGK